jgi:D-glycero-D-manno-heptose 1,7-bisphosphate phosphatase
MTSDAKRRGLFLDRDGVLNALLRTENGSTRPPWNLDEFHMFPEAAAVLSEPCLEEWVQVVVTNQPDIPRGDLTPRNLEKINAQLLQQIPSIEAVFVCQHDNHDNCECRKPLPGLLISAAAELRIDLLESFMIGDRWVDIAAGKNAGATTILIKSAYSWLPSSAGKPPEDLAPDFTIDSIGELSSIILSRSGNDL